MSVLARLDNPYALARHPAVRKALAEALGRRLAGEVTERLTGASAGVQVVADRWVLGSACMPHVCTVEEAFLAYDTQTGAVFTAILHNGDPEVLTPRHPAPWPREVQDYVRAWNARAANMLRLGPAT